MAHYSTHQRHSIPTKYEDKEDDDEEEDGRPPIHKHRFNKYNKTSISSMPKKIKGYVYKPLWRKLNILNVY